MQDKSNLQIALAKKLARNPLFYVCRDIERATGFNLDISNYFIITNKTEYSAKLAKKYKNIYLINSKKLLDTWEILEHKNVKKIIKNKNFILVFKSTKKIEEICKKNSWKLLNPTAKLSSEIEEKISQFYWLENLQKYLPKCEIKLCADIKWKNQPFILQFNHSHTGSGTILIKSQKQLDEIIKKFPKREAKICKYIEGENYTNNNIVWNDKVLMGNINYQITGLKPFTENKFATIGNDWEFAYKNLTKDQVKNYKKIISDIGKKLIKSGWQGLFGVDVVLEKDPTNKKAGQAGKLYLLEINARQPASTAFESILQMEKGTCSSGRSCTSFEAHLASLLKIKKTNEKLIKIKTGAQIIFRKTKKNLPKIKNLENYNIIKYNNTKPESDLLRIQSKTGLIKKHNVILNEVKDLITDSSLRSE